MATLSKHHAVVDALVIVADVKPGDIVVVIGQPLGKAHRTLNATVALEVTAAGGENQLLLQAGFVEPDDLSAVFRPADIVVSVLAPAVFKLQGHPGVRGGKLIRSLQKCRASCKSAHWQIDPCPPKPHLTTNFRSSRFTALFVETVKPTPPY